MLTRNNRLTADRDFEKLFKTGKNFFGRGLAVKIRPNGLGTTRLAFVVGTKVSKKAVDRNLLKRRLREIVRKVLPTAVVGLDIALIARPEALKMTFRELQSEVAPLFRKAGILIGKI